MSMSELDRYSPRLDIRDFCLMSISVRTRNTPSSIFGTWTAVDDRAGSIFRILVECLYQCWLDIPSARYAGLVPNSDVRASSTFIAALYPVLVPNVNLRAGLRFAPDRY
ncbi:hypothetical protein DPMN_052142 [Dreissena polymorpha]|uniref:Uncharacterized protein n=1 Tax=Dreissena polymorpha TaxID=45954 RepID=A0A9D4CKG3_DREPO|nr:hypothetical protein DPMN_052142 [Dreissena polymorpha]